MASRHPTSPVAQDIIEMAVSFLVVSVALNCLGRNPVDAQHVWRRTDDRDLYFRLGRPF
jgi:hypothetical protein